MHSWSDLCVLFQVDASTLWRWCKRSGVVPHQDPADRRHRWLDDSQVLVLARLHRRVVIVDSGSAQLSAVDRLAREVEEIKKRLNSSSPGD